ncbi:hypothetical protein ACHAL6_05635 [Proteiniclasticum sp. C24MP]|uniref:hypothetical protein n=1 Tax=Proteiniclasticum sp. C24MP TaxID=3374101 RepID=UPI003754CC4C
MLTSRKYPCEVITYCKDGRVYPLKFRYYAVDQARYLTVDVEKILYVSMKDKNGLKEMTYHLYGRRKRLKERYTLYLDPRYKTWWVL